MKIISQNTKVLSTSFEFNEAKTEITFQANTELAVEGNEYALIQGDYIKPKLVTNVTLFGLKCLVSELSNIDEIAQKQAQAWVDINYPQI